jgi:hypothetical protein
MKENVAYRRVSNYTQFTGDKVLENIYSNYMKMGK